MSVAAPFVWRCPNNLAVAAFPHPAHRTGHADLPHPAAFTAEVEITLGPLVFDDSFEVKGEFTLGAGSDGINPPNEEVSFAVGTSLPTVIPPGSFEQDAEGSFRFESGSLEFVITPLGGKAAPWI